MNKLNKEQIELINKNAIVNETEKAYKMKVNYIRLDGTEKIIEIWVPKSCTEFSACGILKIKDWFIKNKSNELKGSLTPVLEY